MRELENTVPAWKNYIGKSHIGYNGNCVSYRCSSSGQGFLISTLCLIVIPSALFFAFDCRLLALNISIAIPILAVLLFLFVILTLLRAAYSDPGILPRATNDEKVWVEDFINKRAENNSDPKNQISPRIKEVTILGQSMTLKYCSTCFMFRPPRASHCSTCDNCVDRFDHHCPWIGNCVGRRNYRYFYLFNLSVTIYCLFVTSMTILNVVILSKETDTFSKALIKSPMSIVIGIIALVAVLSVLGLTGYHSYLIAKELSTNEDMKGTFKKRHSSNLPQINNPFNRGNFCKNFLYVLCGPISPNLLCTHEPVDKLSKMTAAAALPIKEPMSLTWVGDKPYPVQKQISDIERGLNSNNGHFSNNLPKSTSNTSDHCYVNEEEIESPNRFMSKQ